MENEKEIFNEIMEHESFKNNADNLRILFKYLTARIDIKNYGNSDNDGHIMFAFFNIKDEDITIKKGEAIGQGVFSKYLVTDGDVALGERTGGFGSTDK